MKNHRTIEPLEARIAPARIFALDGANGLLSFDSATPGTLSAVTAITGLQGGETVKTIDFRPADGLLYAVAISGAAAPFSGRLYKVDTATGAATAVGASAFSTMLTTNSGFGSDFDPVFDVLRVTDLNEENFAVNPKTGFASGDTALTGVNSIAGLAYSNNYAGTAVATAYGINYSNDDLFTIGGLNGTPSATGGVGTKIGDITVTTDAGAIDRIGFDILTTLEGNTAFYTGSVGGAQRLYQLALDATAVATNLGTIGAGGAIFDLAVELPKFTFADGKSFTYTDADGDLVTVKTSAGTLKSSQFGWLPSADGARRELMLMNINQDASFTGADLSFTAKKTATGGDGRVDVGFLSAGGLNLGAVKIGGNLERIQLGTNDANLPSMKSFSALSFGRAATAGDQTSGFAFLNGKVPVFSIKGDITNAFFNIFTAGTFTVGGSIIGGEDADSSKISINVTKSASIGGDIIGGSGDLSAFVNLGGTPTSVKIGGSIIGSTGASSGRLITSPTASLTIGGAIVGGDGQFSGRVDNSATITAAVKLGGSIIGGDGGSSGQFNFGKTGTLTVGGSVVAGHGLASGALVGVGAGTVKIAGSVVGGTTTNTGGVTPGTVGTFTLGGSVLGGKVTGGYSGFLHFETAKSVTIKGSVIGQAGTPVIIGFAGKTNPATLAESIAVGTLTIGRGMVNGEILLGESFTGVIGNVNAAAGKITIGGDFIASSISAGFKRGTDAFFGNTDAPGAMNTLPNIKAAIASIVIKGRATGTASDGDFYGIVAEQIGSVTLAGRKLALNAAATDTIALGAYADFFLRELAIP